MVMQPDLIQTDEDLVDEVTKIIEEVSPMCSSLSTCHIEKMISVLRGNFV